MYYSANELIKVRRAGDSFCGKNIGGVWVGPYYTHRYKNFKNILYISPKVQSSKTLGETIGLDYK